MPPAHPPGRYSQLVGAVGWPVHAVPLLQQLEQLLHRDARVWGAPQCEDLPHQDPKGPPRIMHGKVGVKHILGLSPSLAHCTLQFCGSRDGTGWNTPGEYVLRCPHKVPPSYTWGSSSTCITPQCCLVPHQQHPHPTPNRPSFPSGLTRRSGGCRHGQTGPRVPSTSLAGDPMRATP